MKVNASYQPREHMDPHTVQQQPALGKYTLHRAPGIWSRLGGRCRISSSECDKAGKR
jgi:hypothetical protein